MTLIELVVFPHIIYVIAQKGQLLPPLIDNVWKTTNFKMLHLMTYICYPFKIWRYYYRHSPLKI